MLCLCCTDNPMFSFYIGLIFSNFISALFSEIQERVWASMFETVWLFVASADGCINCCFHVCAYSRVYYNAHIVKIVATEDLLYLIVLCITQTVFLSKVVADPFIVVPSNHSSSNVDEISQHFQPFITALKDWTVFCLHFFTILGWQPWMRVWSF